MFIYTAKLSKAKLIASVVIAAVIIVGIIILAGTFRGEAADDTAAPAAAYKNIKTNDERIAFLSDFGWSVKPDPVSSQEVLIPKEFDEVYAEYNELQKTQGLDLIKYAGKRAKRFTYEITNYPTGQTGVYANILIYKNTVIGGDIMSPELDGFMHGLKMP